MKSKSEIHFEKLVLEIEGAELSKMFGKRCGKINKKTFVGFYKDEMVFKLGKQEVDRLLEVYKGSKNWDPSEKNRGMKDWIQVPVKHMKEWRKLTKQSIEYYKKTAS